MLAGARRSASPTAMGEAIGRSLQQLDDDIANLRGLITELRPAALDQLGLAAALESLTDRGASSEIDVDVDVDLDWEQGRAAKRWTSELETAVYRIVQESLTNAIRHGCARRVAVAVGDSDREVYVTVRDDGTGFDPAGTAGGFGLPGMRERAELLGGTIEIHSSPGSGTTVTATMPLVRRQQPTRPSPIVAPPVSPLAGPVSPPAVNPPAGPVNPPAGPVP
jgi:signal transduction histidine kinase